MSKGKITEAQRKVAEEKSSCTIVLLWLRRSKNKKKCAP